MKPKIVIIVDGGLIQNILSTEEIDVGIIDYDVESVDNPEELTKIPYEFIDLNDKRVYGEDDAMCFFYPPEIDREETEKFYKIIEDSYEMED